MHFRPLQDNIPRLDIAMAQNYCGRTLKGFGNFGFGRIGAVKPKIRLKIDSLQPRPGFRLVVELDAFVDKVTVDGQCQIGAGSSQIGFGNTSLGPREADDLAFPLGQVADPKSHNDSFRREWRGNRFVD